MLRITLNLSVAFACQTGHCTCISVHSPFCVSVIMHAGLTHGEEMGWGGGLNCSDFAHACATAIPEC